MFRYVVLEGGEVVNWYKFKVDIIFEVFFFLFFEVYEINEIKFEDFRL